MRGDNSSFIDQFQSHSSLIKTSAQLTSSDLFQETEHSVMTNSTVDRKRRIASIFQHYYPEGGWGVVLLLAVIMVQVIIHGLLLSYGVLLTKIERRFRVSLLESGQCRV